MGEKDKPKGKRYRHFKDEFPKIMEKYEELGEAIRDGPLDDRTIILFKLGLSIGAAHEGSTHSQVRKALEMGMTADELKHAAVSAITTLGYPSMIRGLAWVEDELDKTNSHT